MAVVLNVKGTSVTSFQIGKQGPLIKKTGDVVEFRDKDDANFADISTKIINLNGSTTGTIQAADDISLTARGGDTNAANAGDIILEGGDSSSTFDAGDVVLRAGTAGGSGADGSVVIEGTGSSIIQGDVDLPLTVKGGNSLAADAGDLILQGGNGTGGFASGDIILQAGTGGSAEGTIIIDGPGASTLQSDVDLDLTVKGGNASAAAAGDLVLQGGPGTGGFASGDLTLSGGTGGSADGKIRALDEVTLLVSTVAGLPTGEEGSVVYCSNGDAGSPCLAVHNGTDWKVVALGATVSAV